MKPGAFDYGVRLQHPTLVLMLSVRCLTRWARSYLPGSTYWSPSVQGLTLVHFSAQLKRFPWDR